MFGQNLSSSDSTFTKSVVNYTMIYVDLNKGSIELKTLID